MEEGNSKTAEVYEAD